MSTPEQNPIIAIHGAGMQAGIWGILSENLPCRALSLPGHGETAGPLLASIPGMAAWVQEQIKDKPAGSVILMGHSMGALVALEAAASPAVAGLILMGVAAEMPVHPDLLEKTKTDPAAAAALILKWGVSPLHPEAATALKKHMQPETLFNDLSACNDSKQGAATAKTMRKPALIIAGADDKLTKASEGKALAEMLGAQFHVIKGSGHMLMVENPLEITQEIRAFRAGLTT